MKGILREKQKEDQNDRQTQEKIRELYLLGKTKKFYEETPFESCDIDESFYYYLGIESDWILPNIGDDLIIDVGCGMGWISNYFKKVKGKKVISVDLSFSALKLAKKYYNLNVIQANNMYLPFKSNIAGLVISTGVIHHTPNAYKSFKELVRILKPGGMLILHIYNKDSIYYLVYKYIGGILRKGINVFKPIEKFYKIFLLPIFCLPGRLGCLILRKKWAKRSQNQAWNGFRDFYLTPEASFFKTSDIKKWVSLEDNLKILKCEKGGFMLCYVLQKNV